MFMLINAEMTPKMRERSERAKKIDFFTLYVTFMVLDENWNLKKNIKIYKVVQNVFGQYSI